MKTLKLLAITLASVIGVLTSAHAQPIPSYQYTSIPFASTVGAATTTNFVTPPYIDASKQQNVAFLMGNIWTTAGEATGSTNLIYTLAPTIDGSHYSTNNTVLLASYNRAASAGFTNYTTTNLSANGIKGWFIIKAVNNSAGGTCTNGTGGAGSPDAFQYSNKIGAP